MKNDLLSMRDLTAQDVVAILKTAQRLKARRRRTRDLEGKTLGMIFQKPSTRTSVSFAVAMYELGGNTLTLNAQDLQIKRGETMADTARTLSRYLSGIMIRAHRHEDVVELARCASAPVINGLTDQEHPCQVLADLLTIVEVFRLKKVEDIRKIRVTYVGDGNNMTQSWMLAAALLGMQLTISCPKGYDPRHEFFKDAAALGKKSGGKIIVERDPRKAVRSAQVLYTDVWISMGQETERERRLQIFRPYQVNAKLAACAPNPFVMHCLPAHRGEEITGDVLDGPRSIVFDQAENRLHVQKAVLLHCLKD